MTRDAGWIGRTVPLLEARRLLVGAGRFVADLTPPDALHMAVLRSPHASARLVEIDARAAREPLVSVRRLAVHEHT